MKRMDKYEWVDSYFSDELSAEEKSQFENSLKEDSELKEIFDLHTNISKSVKEKEKIEFISKLKKSEESFIKNRNKIFEFKGYLINKNNLLSWAAVIILFIASGLFILLRGNNLSYDQLYDRYYATYDQIIETRGPELNNVQLALLEYQNGNYSGAIQLFNKNQSSVNNDLVRFYKGLCYLEVQEYEKASIQFEKITQSSNDFRQEADWYLALSYLKTGEIDKAQQLLKSISQNDNHYYKRNARKVLQHLK
mgnify:CR=1 FL=1